MLDTLKCEKVNCPLFTKGVLYLGSDLDFKWVNCHEQLVLDKLGYANLEWIVTLKK